MLQERSLIVRDGSIDYNAIFKALVDESTGTIKNLKQSVLKFLESSFEQIKKVKE